MPISHTRTPHYTQYCFNDNYLLPVAPKPTLGLGRQRSIRFRDPDDNLLSRYPTHSTALVHNNSAMDQTLKELIAAVTHGLHTKINRIALAQQNCQLTEKVTADLYNLSHRQLQDVHSVFSKRQYQEIVNQLFLTGSRLLDEQEKASLASMPSIPLPKVPPEQPCFDQRILSLVEAVLQGKQQ